MRRKIKSGSHGVVIEVEHSHEIGMDGEVNYAATKTVNINDTSLTKRKRIKNSNADADEQEREVFQYAFQKWVERAKFLVMKEYGDRNWGHVADKDGRRTIQPLRSKASILNTDVEAIRRFLIIGVLVKMSSPSLKIICINLNLSSKGELVFM